MTDFPSAWNVRPLGKLVDVLDARRVPVSAKERAKRFGDVPYYGATGQVGWINHALFNEPLVLLGEDGVQFFDAGKSKSYLIDGPAWVNNHAHVLRTREDIDRKFLNYYLNAAEYRGFANGTTRLKLTQAAMRRISIPVPPPYEQRRIVDLLEDHLSRLDAADREVVRAKEKLDSLWRSALTAARDSFSAGPRAIGDIASTSLGKMLDAKKQSGEPIPYLRNINVRWGSLDLADLQTTPLEPNEVAKFDLREGDIMVCEGGEPGRCAVWRGDGSGIAFQKALHRIRVGHRAEVLPDFLALMLEECIRSGRADRLFTGTTIKHLPQEKLRTIEIVLPSLDDQQAALQRLGEVAEARERLRSSLIGTMRTSQALRRSLLAAAFSGRLTGAASDLSVAEEMIGA